MDTVCVYLYEKKPNTSYIYVQIYNIMPLQPRYRMNCVTNTKIYTNFETDNVKNQFTGALISWWCAALLENS